jgi:hypothetical protein
MVPRYVRRGARFESRQSHVILSSYSTVPGIFPAVELLGREFDQSLSSAAKVKNEWRYTPTPSICLHGVERDKLGLTLPFIAVRKDHCDYAPKC